MDIWKELQDEGVDAGLLEEIRRFRAAHPLTEEAAARVPAPRYLYYGREIWESAAAALLCGQHVLLALGPARTCWRKIWRRCSAAPCGMCPCTSMWTRRR